MSSSSRGFLASPEGLTLLQAAKAERGWTFAAIAARAGVSANTVSRLFHPERGKRVSRKSIRAIAKALKLFPEGIVQGNESLTISATRPSNIFENIFDSSILELQSSLEPGINISSERFSKIEERSNLFHRVDSLTPFQFSSLIFALSLPAGQRPASAKARSEFTYTLLQWAESVSGPGLEVVDQVIAEMSGESEYPDITSAPDYIKRLRLIDFLNSLSPPQFEEVLHNIGAPSWAISSSSEPRAKRSLELLEWLEGLSGSGLSALGVILSKNLKEASLSKLPETFEAERRIENAIAKSQKTLDLSRLNLNSIPGSIIHLNSLERLSLAQNQLTSFPKEVMYLTNISNYSKSAGTGRIHRLILR